MRKIPSVNLIQVAVETLFLPDTVKYPQKLKLYPQTKILLLVIALFTPYA